MFWIFICLFTHLLSFICFLTTITYFIYHLFLLVFYSFLLSSTRLQFISRFSAYALKLAIDLLQTQNLFESLAILQNIWLSS